MTNLDSMLKQRHYFANKGLSSQGYGFPVVVYGCESWTRKKAESWGIDAFVFFFVCFVLFYLFFFNFILFLNFT